VILNLAVWFTRCHALFAKQEACRLSCGGIDLPVITSVNVAAAFAGGRGRVRVFRLKLSTL